jgi:hypothetical protein
MNQNLADELVTMMTEDQRLLQQLFDSGELPSESYHPRMKALHEHNASRLKEIIGAHGWPPEFDSYPLKIVSFTHRSPVFMRVSAF